MPSRQGVIAVGVAAFGALVPAAAALGPGSPEPYMTGMHHAIHIGAIVAAAGATGSAALLGGVRRRGAAAGLVAEPA
jgi:hypothetical protein